MYSQYRMLQLACRGHIRYESARADGIVRLSVAANRSVALAENATIRSEIRIFFIVNYLLLVLFYDVGLVDV